MKTNKLFKILLLWITMISITLNIVMIPNYKSLVLLLINIILITLCRKTLTFKEFYMYSGNKFIYKELHGQRVSE